MGARGREREGEGEREEFRVLSVEHTPKNERADFVAQMLHCKNKWVVVFSWIHFIRSWVGRIRSTHDNIRNNSFFLLRLGVNNPQLEGHNTGALLKIVCQQAYFSWKN